MKMLSTWQTKIQTEIRTILSQAVQEFGYYSLDLSQIEYLQQLATKGKQFRGCLLTGFYQSVVGKVDDEESVLRLAAAIELYGTGILIQDDVIDRSDQRRTLPTVHRYMEKVGAEHQLKEPAHFGISAAICLADFLFFIADKTVAELKFSPQLRLGLALINSTELAQLGLAEIEDVRLAFSNQSFSRKDIYNMYIGKTGRYTGRWPLILAGKLAGLPEEVVNKIGKIGEKIGLLYQLKDDELGIFGDQEKTGKPITSDLLEGKKTLYYWYLKNELSPKQQQLVFGIIGNSLATAKQLEQVRKLIKMEGIQEKVVAEMDQLQQEIITSINSLTLPQSTNEFLNQIVTFVVSRNK